MAETKRVQVGVVGVDSGQVMVCDPCYIERQWKDRGFSPSMEENKSRKYRESREFSYDGCCRATMREARAGQLNYALGHAGAAVAVSSGYGDGFYPVYATYEDGRVKKIEIEFF